MKTLHGPLYTLQLTWYGHSIGLPQSHLSVKSHKGIANLDTCLLGVFIQARRTIFSNERADNFQRVQRRNDRKHVDLCA